MECLHFWHTHQLDVWISSDFRLGKYALSHGGFVLTIIIGASAVKNDIYFINVFRQSYIIKFIVENDRQRILFAVKPSLCTPSKFVQRDLHRSLKMISMF